MDLGLSGLASGFDWKSLVDQLVQVERTPQQRLLADQNQIQQRKNAYSSIQTQLSVLNNRITALKDSTLYDVRSARTSDSAAATASATSGAPLGSYAFTITQRATAASQQGTTNVGKALNTTNDVSGLTLSNATFAAAITAGTITVNGKQVAVSTSDTLQDLFDKIATATSNAVTGSYDATTDQITLSSASTIVLGSATDTSNFLQAAKLTNNGSGTIASSSTLGSVQVGKTLSSANLAAAISDGGSGAGEFKINGVSISFSATGDTISTVIKRINDSAAGVTASYDSVNDRFVLANKATGDVGVGLEDVTGNFLASTGLSGGTLSRGKNLLYTVNDGGTLSSQSNTITEASSGIAGLTVSALKEGTFTIAVDTDKTKIKAAINDFITEYNKAQSMIDAQTASTTDSKGKVTAGLLSKESDASEIATKLRSLAYGQVAGLTGTLKSLADLGIETNGDNHNLKVGDEELLDSVLDTNLSGVKELFSHSTKGVAVTLAAYMEKTIGEEGSLIARTDLLSKQSLDIDTQVADMERLVQAHKTSLTESFVRMETAKAKTDQQMQFLQQRFKQTS